MKYLLLYLIAINIVGFAIMGIDKRKAKRHSSRVSEKTLFTIALVGGSIGVKFGMELFRHKTKHKKFIFGIPAIIILQLAAAFFIVYKFFEL
ncbi:MAG: hypothetical protein A2Y23_01900 [Clostridiales bacterium GWB2_37_7]|nr:MAG: hypothetical protein A2Y23_01900 [Clostridiales bacterium GWB2_37_7]